MTDRKPTLFRNGNGERATARQVLLNLGSVVRLKPQSWYWRCHSRMAARRLRRLYRDAEDR